MRSCHNVLWEKSLSSDTDETASDEFTQQQAQEMYEFIKHVANGGGDNFGDAKQLLKQLESGDE